MNRLGHVAKWSAEPCNPYEHDYDDPEPDETPIERRKRIEECEMEIAVMRAEARGEI